MKILILVAILPVVAWACSTLNVKFGVKEDSIPEEIFEDVFKQNTGIEIDLTPNSPER